MHFYIYVFLIALTLYQFKDCSNYYYCFQMFCNKILKTGTLNTYYASSSCTFPKLELLPQTSTNKGMEGAANFRRL